MSRNAAFSVASALALAALVALPATAQVVVDEVPVPATTLLVAPAESVPAAVPAAVAASTTPMAASVTAVATAQPNRIAASFVTPPRDASGAYVTPNRDLSPEQAIWHLRVALNVAALRCRDADETMTVAAYNKLLTTAKRQLAAAQSAVATQYKTRFGAAAQAHQDDAMTRLYNFFAQPVAHVGFCTAAKAVLADSTSVAPAQLAGFAPAALTRLEAPFLAFFAEYDHYLVQLAAWQAAQPGAAAVQATPVAATSVTIAAAAR